MKFGLVLLIAILLFVGCSKPAPQKQFDQLKLTYKPFQKPAVQRQIPILSVLVDATTTTRTGLGDHITYASRWMCFANYDLSENPDRPNTKILKEAPPGSDIEPIRACITLNDKEGTTAATPLKPGNYFIGLTNQHLDSIVDAGIFWDKGKLGSQALFDLPQMKGQLRIDSVSDDAFSGEFDLSDGENSMVATFNGKANIKKYGVARTN